MLGLWIESTQSDQLPCLPVRKEFGDEEGLCAGQCLNYKPVVFHVLWVSVWSFLAVLMTLQGLPYLK